MGANKRRHWWSHRLLAAPLGGALLLCAPDLRAEWTQVATLTRPTNLGGDGKNFGERALACGGGTVLVGASGEDSYHGAVYAFSGADYASVQRLTVPEEFTVGANLAISGDTFLAGSSQIDSATVSFFVQRDGAWELQQTVESSGDARYGAFGDDVALHGDLAAVAAPKEAGDLGRIHVYGRQAGVWSEEAVLAASDGAQNDFFGLGMGFSEDSLIAGAPTNPIDDAPRGAAYIFSRAASGWTQQARLDLTGQTPSTPAIYYGGSADIDGNWAVVSGSAGTDEPVAPRAYTYYRNGSTWQPVQTLVLPGSERLGAQVKLQRDRLFIATASGDAQLLHEYRLSSGQWALRQTLPAFSASSKFAVCGSTLLRSNDGTIVVYQDPTAGADPTTPSTAQSSSRDEGDGNGCSLTTAPARATGSTLLGMALLLLLAAPALLRRAAGPRAVLVRHHARRARR